MCVWMLFVNNWKMELPHKISLNLYYLNQRCIFQFTSYLPLPFIWWSNLCCLRQKSFISTDILFISITFTRNKSSQKKNAVLLYTYYAYLSTCVNNNDETNFAFMILYSSSLQCNFPPMFFFLLFLFFVFIVKNKRKTRN